MGCRAGIGLLEGAQDHGDGSVIRILRVRLAKASDHTRHLVRVLALGRADAEHTRIIRVAEQGGAQDSREISQTEPGSGRIRNLNAQALHAAIVFDLSARLEQPARGQFCLRYGRARNMKGAAEQKLQGDQGRCLGRIAVQRIKADRMLLVREPGLQRVAV